MADSASGYADPVQPLPAPGTRTSPPDAGTGRLLLVSQRLRDRRRSLGLTQQQVVLRLGRLGLTITNKALSGLEHGAGVDVAKLPELAAALDCSVTWLLGLTEDPDRWQPDHLLRPQAVPPDATTSAPRVPTPTPAEPAAQPSPRPWILAPLPSER